jgi:hypothetical protein
LGGKLRKQKECDKHCYKDWYEYNALFGNSRTREMDALFSADLLYYCPCNKVSCSFVDEDRLCRMWGKFADINYVR